MTDERLVRVINDEDAIRRSLDFILRAAGHRVELWPNGKIILEGNAHEVSACVLLRYCLPRANGLEDEARMSTMGVDLPVILVTAKGGIGVGMRATAAAAPNCLGRRFDRNKLLRAVETAFNQVADKELLSGTLHWTHVGRESLTAPELKVLKDLACGVTNKVVAYDVESNPRTIEVFRSTIITKLSVFNFSYALRIAFAAGLGFDVN